MIVYVPHNEIDKKKWDKCIEKSQNEFIYAYSWYLDMVSPGWDALICDDYQALMPLTWSEKWTIKYLYPPLFTQQLGIFSIEELTPELVDEMISAIPQQFRYLHIKLNGNNPVPDHSKFNFQSNNNHQIDLSKKYDLLYDSFNRNCRRNINKALACGLKISSDISAKSFAQFVKSNLEYELKMMHNKDFDLLENLIRQLKSKNACEIYGAYAEADELCAVALFLITGKRCIFSVCASSEPGKKCQAMYLLVSSQIKKYAGSGKIFDFSGSNIPGIAYFNSTFGSEVMTYPIVTLNRLPWALKIFKK